MGRFLSYLLLRGAPGDTECNTFGTFSDKVLVKSRGDRVPAQQSAPPTLEAYQMAKNPENEFA